MISIPSRTLAVGQVWSRGLMRFFFSLFGTPSISQLCSIQPHAMQHTLANDSIFVNPKTPYRAVKPEIN